MILNEKAREAMLLQRVISKIVLGLPLPSIVFKTEKQATAFQKKLKEECCKLGLTAKGEK